jgi:uncharacterized protein (DUF305 family)
MRQKHIPLVVALIANVVCIHPSFADDTSKHAMSTMGGNEHEAAYMAENATAMTRMMAEMDVKPTGDVDRDFVAMMTPHHQGAIDMANAVLKHGKNEQIRRIAQKIIIDQQQEITAMELAISEPLLPYKAAGSSCSGECANPAPQAKPK